MSNFGREPFQLLEIDQPQCALVYGNSPCTAALGGTTGDHKCVNTRATCQDPANYTPTVTVPLRFIRSQQRGPERYGPAVPMIEGPIRTSPAGINPGGMNRNAKALGEREVVTVQMKDGRHSGLQVDPYRLERATGAASASLGEVSFDWIDGLERLQPVHGAELATLAVTRAGATATRVNAQGLIELVPADTPRFDYHPASRLPLGLLIEEARTNYVIASDDPTNATYWYSDCTITPNVASLMASGPTMDRIEDSFATWRLVRSSVITGLSPAVPSKICASCYVMKDSVGKATRYPLLRITYPGPSQIVDFTFDTSTGEFAAFDFYAETTIHSAGVQDCGDKWRIWVAASNSHAAATSAQIDFYPAVGHTTLGSYDATATGSVVAGGFQLEFSDHPSSYIPTGTATVTRNADVPSCTDISGFYNASEGSFIVEYSLNSSELYNGIVSFHDGTVNEELGAYTSSGGALLAFVVDSGVSQYQVNHGVPSLGTAHRLAMAYKLNDFASSEDGAATSTDSSGTIPTVNRLQLGMVSGANQIDGHIRRFTYYPRRLTDAQLQALSGSSLLPQRTVPFGANIAEPYERGTFWGKWIAANPYHQGYAARVYEGFVGDALEDCKVRHYLLDRVDGPSEGKTKVVLKDLLAQLDARKAVAPLASRGELAAGITPSSTSVALNPPGIGNAEYAASGHVVIADEAIAYTRSGDTLTMTGGRGALGTTADDHDDDDLVQQVLHLAPDFAHEHIYTLLTVYGFIPAANIDKAKWDALAAPIIDLYSAYITKPTPVTDLVSELCEQAGITLYHDTATNMVELIPLRPSAALATIDDRDWIIENSFGVRQQPATRVSQVWVYHGVKNWVEDLEPKNFHSRVISADLTAEAAEQYGTPAIRVLHSRWVPQGGRASATKTANRLLSAFRNPPREYTFDLYVDREPDFKLALPYEVRTSDVQDALGNEDTVTVIPISIERDEVKLSVSAQELDFALGADDPNQRDIYIDNDVLNINLRTLHDSLYPAPTGVAEVVRYFVNTVVTVGSVSTSQPAIESGNWPTMTNKPRIVNAGIITGKGGAGGAGQANAVGLPGSAGGTAIKATVPIEIDNLNGHIWGGGGGGGGGGAIRYESPYNSYGTRVGGAGGGAGAGNTSTAGATHGGSAGLNHVAPSAGGTGTTSAGGAAGTRGYTPDFASWGAPSEGGYGGAGGGPGLAGGAGTVAIPRGGIGTSYTLWSPGTGGAAGKYIDGNSNVTWINNGDLRGGVA